jgi:hypothetical protein
MPTEIKTTSMINGIEVPVNQWHSKIGSYGSIGSASFTTSRKMLANKGIEILDLVSGGGKNIPVDVYVTLGNDPQFHCFGGYLDALDIEYDSDTVVLSGRDFASEMVDSRRVLNLNEYTNKTPSQIAEKLAEDFGLTPKITASPGGVLAGSFFNRDAVLSRQSRPVWTTLVWLAQQIGFQVYVNPEKELVFCPVDSGEDMKTFIWKPTSNNYSGIIVKNLHVKHSIKRNRSFKVRVLSYHPKTTKTTTSEVTIFGENVSVPVAGSDGTTTRRHNVREGYYRGSAGSRAASESRQAGLDVPTYTFNYSGLTPDQCKAKAEAIAENIAHKLFTVDALMSGRTDLKMHQQVKLDGTIEDLIKGKTFFITALNNSFSQPSDGGEGGGFVTSVVMNTLPPTSTEDPGSLEG